MASVPQCRYRSSLQFSLLLSALLAVSSCGGNSSSPQRQMLSISVQPSSAEAVAPGGTAPFTANATFDQAPTDQEGITASWNSSDSTIATVDVQTGIATCVAAGGPVIVTATSGGKKATASLECAATSTAVGNCVYVCGSTRCGALTGYCSVNEGGMCRQVYDAAHCPLGKPAGGTATSCGVGIDTTRTCGASGP